MKATQVELCTETTGWPLSDWSDLPKLFSLTPPFSSTQGLPNNNWTKLQNSTVVKKQAKHPSLRGHWSKKMTPSKKKMHGKEEKSRNPSDIICIVENSSKKWTMGNLMTPVLEQFMIKTRQRHELLTSGWLMTGSWIHGLSKIYIYIYMYI